MIHLRGPARFFGRKSIAGQAELFETVAGASPARLAYLGVDPKTLVGPVGQGARWRETVNVDYPVPLLSPGTVQTSRCDLRLRRETGDSDRDVS